MLRNHLITAIRHLVRGRQFTLLNLLGLTVGMVACLAILQLVRYEWSYDRQSPHAEHIWRVYCETISNATTKTLDANTHSAIGPALDSALTEVVAHTRLYNRNEDEVVFLHDNQPLKIAHNWMVDPDFLEMFPPSFLAGDPTSCLSTPYAMVLTASTATLLCKPAADPDNYNHYIGQTLEVPGGVFQGIYTVTGIVADPPQNTHLKFNILTSYATRYAKGHRDNWGSYWGYTYFQTSPNAEIENIRQQLNRLSEQHLADDGLRLQMQPFTDIHLYSDLTYEIEANGNARMINFIGLIGIFILLIAFFNYINMMTARAITRAGEVGIRKVVGASRPQLIQQFLLEGLLTNAGALLLAVLILPYLLSWLEVISGRPLYQAFVLDGLTLLSLVGILSLSVLISCLYPALTLSRYQPLQVIKGKFSKSTAGWSLRKGLVVFQFTCSTILIICVVVVNKQLTFLKQHDLGLSLTQQLAVKMPALDYRQDSTAFSRFSTFKNEAEKLPGIHQISSAGALPGLGISSISGGSGGVHWAAQPSASTQAATYYLDVSPDFFQTFGVRILSGDLFEANSREESTSNVIINEVARKMLGLPDAPGAVGEAIAFDHSPGRKIRIRAVVDDFHIESLKQAARPTLYYLNPRIVNGYFAFKLAPAEIASTLNQLQEIWQQQFPASPMEFWFLDKHFSQQYTQEEQLSDVFKLFAGLAIFIACLGLIGLAIYDSRQRTKEIGIRKILGASAGQIIQMLSKEAVLLITLAILLASPLAYHFMNSWLEGFAHRISIPLWVFPVSGIAMLAASILSTSYQTIRAAIANPAESLKYE